MRTLEETWHVGLNKLFASDVGIRPALRSSIQTSSISIFPNLHKAVQIAHLLFSRVINNATRTHRSLRVQAQYWERCYPRCTSTLDLSYIHEMRGMAGSSNKRGTQHSSLRHSRPAKIEKRFTNISCVIQVCRRMLALRDNCIHPTSKKPYILDSSGGRDNSPEGHQVVPTQVPGFCSSLASLLLYSVLQYHVWVIQYREMLANAQSAGRVLAWFRFPLCE